MISFWCGQIKRLLQKFLALFFYIVNWSIIQICRKSKKITKFKLAGSAEINRQYPALLSLLLEPIIPAPAGKPGPEIESFLELSSRLFGHREEQERLALGTCGLISWTDAGNGPLGSSRR